MFPSAQTPPVKEAHLLTANSQDGGQAGVNRMSSTKFVLVKIPNHLDFEDLNLSFDPVSRIIECDWAPLGEILDANADLALRCGEHITDLLGAWYRYLRLSGYRKDVAEECLVSFAAAQEFGMERILAGPDTAH